MLDTTNLLSTVDLDCYSSEGALLNTATDPGCMHAIAKGEDNDPTYNSIEGKYRGHKCAECFAVYAMGVLFLILLRIVVGRR